MEKLSFFKLLITSSNGISSRRAIALLLLPLYMGANICGIILSFVIHDFRYFLTSIIALGTPIMIAYFLLTWEHVISIAKNINSFQKTQEEITNINEHDEKY